MSMRRRSVLLALASAPVVGCRKPPQREEVLSELVRQVVVPDTRAVLLKSQRMRQAVTSLASTPNPATLGLARGAFAEALLAWKRAQCFKNGPMVETNALLRATFWPPRATAIDALLNGAEPIDAARVAALGVDVKGMYALEYALFPAGLGDDAALAWLVSEPGRRRLHFADALASSVCQYVERAEQALGDGSEFSQRFAKGAKANLSKLVTQMIASVETLAVNRLDSVLGLSESHLLKPADVEGAPSHVSHRLAQVEIESVQQLYRGPGDASLSALVHSLTAPVDARLLAAFEDAQKSLAALTQPIEIVVQQSRPLLAKALSDVKELERRLKVDLASALGVTLTFQMGDGD